MGSSGGTEAEAVELRGGQTTRRGHVAVVDGSVRVDGWRTATPEVVRYFEERLEADTDLSEALDLALKVGAVALGSVGVSVNVDYVEKEFERFTNRVEATLTSRLEQVEGVFEEAFAEDDGSLAAALSTYLGEGGQLAELFDPNRRDSAIGRMRELLAEHFEGEGSRLHRLLDISNDDSPLTSWRDEIEDGFHGLRRLLEEYRKELAETAAAREAGDEARADERDKGTAKGRDFEALAFDAVNAIAAVFGDTAEPTGDRPATGGGKVGDVVVTVNARDTRGADVRIVFEAKDRDVGLTPILRELDSAKDNRGAVAAVAVYARPEHMPTGAIPFREQGGGRFLCLYDRDDPDDLCLQTAYRLARFWAVADLARDDVDVDARGIRDDLEAARHLLGNVSTIKARLTKMRNAVDDAAGDIEQDLERLRSELVQAMDRIDSRIRLDAG